MSQFFRRNVFRFVKYSYGHNKDSMAEMYKLSESLIRHILAGIAPVTDNTLYCFQRAHGVSMDDFTGCKYIESSYLMSRSQIEDSAQDFVDFAHSICFDPCCKN